MWDSSVAWISDWDLKEKWFEVRIYCRVAKLGQPRAHRKIECISYSNIELCGINFGREVGGGKAALNAAAAAQLRPDEMRPAQQRLEELQCREAASKELEDALRWGTREPCWTN